MTKENADGGNPVQRRDFFCRKISNCEHKRTCRVLFMLFCGCFCFRGGVERKWFCLYRHGLLIYKYLFGNDVISCMPSSQAELWATGEKETYLGAFDALKFLATHATFSAFLFTELGKKCGHSSREKKHCHDNSRD